MYSIKLYTGITTSMCFALSISVLFSSLMQSVNGAQFLNISLFPFSSDLFVSSSAPAPVIVIVLLKSMYASL